MPARRQAINALQKQAATRPGIADLWHTILHFEARSPSAEDGDRATALVLGSILEQGIEIAVLSHTVLTNENEQKELFGPPDGAAMNFYTKIQLAYALGVFGTNSKDDLNVIRHVRNAFAHARIKLSFESPEVFDLCDCLKWKDFLIWGGRMGPKPQTGRDIFVQAIKYYYSFFVSNEEDGKPISYRTYAMPELYD